MFDDAGRTIENGILDADSLRAPRPVVVLEAHGDRLVQVHRVPLAPGGISGRLFQVQSGKL